MSENSDQDGNGQDRETNPFVLFRRAVDAQIAAALAVLGDDDTLKRIDRAFDRSMNPLRVQTERDEPENNQQDIWHHIERAFDRTMNPMRINTEEEAGHTRDPSDPRSWSPAEVRAAQVAAGCPSVYAQSDPDEMLKRHDERSHVQEEGARDENMWTSDGWGPAWTFDFFDRSSYSPLHLEKEMQKARVNWRHAFEDLLLLDAVHDEPDALNLFGKRDPSLDRMTGQQWKHALLESGLLHSRNIWREPIQHFFNTDPMQIMQEVMTKLHSTAFEAHQRLAPETELEFYETMAKRDTLSKQQEDVRKQDTPVKPDIISQVTTVQRRILGDGTASYKKVFTRKFTDGSEETETEEHEDKIPPRQLPLPSAEKAHPRAETSNTSSKGSWLSFWQS